MLILRIMQPLDGTDTRLLSAMAKDPRGTVVALAQKLGLSRNTVQARMAQLEKKHVLAEAEERRARMRRDAEFRVEQELRAARVELLREAVQNATVAAEEIIRKGSAQADNDRMAEDYIAAVRSAYAPTTSAPTTGGRS